MAESPTHKFGQIIGDILEASMEDPIREFVSRHPGLYLDKKGDRPARGRKKKSSWVDKYGNSHDLDFVIERGGSPNKIGRPAAFIEIAWRRYTKHSRNKAQEIQGAIVPLAETYKNDCPFLGVVIAGVFTQGSINQLESLGFTTLYFDYDTIIDAFSTVGIDAYFQENTPDKDVRKKVVVFSALSQYKKDKIKERLRSAKRKEINKFIERLERSFLRKIDSIRIIALYGHEHIAYNIEDAINYITSCNIDAYELGFVKFEIYIRYNNGDKIDASFQDKENAISFLNSYKFFI